MKVPMAAIGKAVKCVKCAEKIVLSPENTQRPRESQSPSIQQAETLPPPASGPGDKKVGQLLIGEGLISERHLQEALERQAREGGKLFENLIALNHLDTKALHKFLSKQSGVASIDLKHYEIPVDLISLIPRDFAQKNVVLPIDKMGKLLTVGMACPLDTATIADLERITGLKVKAMLCAFDDIHITIDRYYPKEPGTYVERPTATMPRGAPAPKPSGMKRDVVVKRLTELDLLPPLAGTVDDVKQAVGSSPQAIRDVAGIVCADPVVAAALLSVANCSPYGLPGQVVNINLAVTLLGLTGTRDVTVQFEESASVHPSSKFDPKLFWLRSMFCATASMSIARASNRGEVGDAYTVGLLHEIGRLALAAALPEAYASVAEEMPDDDRVRAEEGVFSITHSEAGYLMATKWKLPPAVADPIRRHHATDGIGQDKDLVAIVTLAAAMADAFVRGTPLGDALKERRHVMSSLLMDEAAITHIHEKTSDTIRSIAR